MNSSPNQDEVSAIRGKLWQNGFRPVSVFSPGAVEWTGQPIANAGKRPNCKNWRESALASIPDACTAKPSMDALNTGILCDGLVALDVDIDDPALANQAIGAAIHFLGSAPMRVRSDSARVLMLYRAAEGEPKKRSIDGTGGKVEALGSGQQFVAFGQHPSGAAYTWPQGSPAEFSRDALTAVTADALQAFLCAVAPLVGAVAPALPTTAPAGLSAAPVPSHVTERECAYAAQALADEISKLEALGPGDGRNHALNVAAHSMGTMSGAGWIDVGTVSQALLNAASANGHTFKHGEQQTIKTIESGLNAGMSKPREPLAVVPAIDISSMIANGIAACKRKESQVVVSGKRRINLVRMDSIEEEAITWLWEGFLPKATLTLLGGAIQAGKSTIAMSLAATVSNGGLWPDGTRCTMPGNVIFWSSEEVVKSVVKPRLMAVGANTSRILTIESSLDEHGEPCAFDPSQDIPLLRREILNLGSVSLVIIDPMITAVSGDTNKANDVRRSLKPIIDLAEEFDCTVLGIHHLAKNSEGKSTNDRMLGSQAFAAMARIVLVAAKDENSDNRVLAISKSNISKDNGGFNYTIEGVSFPSPKGKEIKTSKVIWGEALEGSSRAILATAEGEPNEDTSKLGQAKQFLIESLATQAVGSRELLRNAREGYGISDKTLRRAAKALSVTAEHAPTFEGGWSWSLPTSNLRR